MSSIPCVVTLPRRTHRLLFTLLLFEVVSLFRPLGYVDFCYPKNKANQVLITKTQKQDPCASDTARSSVGHVEVSGWLILLRPLLGTGCGPKG